MDEYLGIVKLFAGNFAPRGWALCDGSLLNINTNTALFAILGTTYGGNGQTTFALPNLLGRTAVGAGSGAGLTPITAGQSAGTNSVTMTTANLPAHTHALQGNTGNGTATSPTGAVPAVVTYVDGDGTTVPTPAYAATGNTAMGNTGATGSGQPVSVMQPYLGMVYIICTQGIFPSRN